MKFKFVFSKMNFQLLVHKNEVQFHKNGFVHKNEFDIFFALLSCYCKKNEFVSFEFMFLKAKL
jgi:hypothetical protein